MRSASVGDTSEPASVHIEVDLRVGELVQFALLVGRAAVTDQRSARIIPLHRVSTEHFMLALSGYLISNTELSRRTGASSRTRFILFFISVCLILYQR